MPLATRTFRIFVSSTFEDLKEERNALQERVFPRLRELCLAHGARFQAIDLRWGVSGEASLDQQAINICLGEIERCHAISPRPNFMVLLGDRYGWRPPPPQIPADEFELILRLADDEDKKLLTKWYPRDDNAIVGCDEDPLRADEDGWQLKDGVAVLPEHCLNPREGDLRDDDKWAPIETRLRSILLEAVKGTKLEDDPRYRASVTEQEIVNGALNVPDAEEHVFCFFRTITNLDELKADIPKQRVARPTVETRQAEDFVDLRNPETDRKVDTEASRHLGGLKERLRARLPGNIHEYESEWTEAKVTTRHIGELPDNLDDCLRLNIVEAARRLLADRPDASMEEIAQAAVLDLAALRRHFPSRDQLVSTIQAEAPPLNLCADVWLRLSRVILEELRKLEAEDDLERELSEHRRFGAERAKHFVGRQDVLERIAEHLAGADPHPLVVYGASGSGKSALIARAAQQAKERYTDAQHVVRFMGATPDSADGRALLRSLCREIIRRYREAGVSAPPDEPGLLDETTVPSDYQGLVQDFPKRLALASAERPLIIFLDALDQFSEREAARSLAWLPRDFPPHVRMVVSVLQRDPGSGGATALASVRDPLDALRARFLPANLLELEPMSREHGHMLLARWLADVGRALTDDQRGEVLAKFEPLGLPLYLRLAFEEARRWKSYTPAEDRILSAAGIPGIIRENLIARLTTPENHGELIVSRSLAYLAAARNGLSEDEILDLLSRQEMFDDLRKRSPKSPKVDRLPVVVWSRLYFDLNPYLTERRADGALLMTFYHRQLGEEVQSDYLQGDAGRDRHRELAVSFANDELQPLERSVSGKPAANFRRLSELPYQQTRGELWEEVYETLTDFHFLEVKAANSGVVEATDAEGNITRTYTGAYLLQDDYALALERMPGADSRQGSRQRIIVTVTDLGHGLQIRCPYCNELCDFQDKWLGSEEDCPRCGRPWKVNAFVVTRSAT